MKKFKNDIILFAGILCLALLALLVFNLTKKEGKFVTVSINGKIEYTYNLSENMEKVIQNGVFSNTLVIKDNKVSVSYANCRDKICVNHRSINSVGETIVCLPHKLVIAITDRVNTNE